MFFGGSTDYASKITEIIFEEESNCKIIGTYAFAYCTKLTSIVIPDSVVKIGTAVFSGCSSLKEMTIPFVGSEAGKTSKDTYQYPFGYIFGMESFKGATSAPQYYYGDSVKSTDFSIYYIPNSLWQVTVTCESILYGAFYNCNRLTSIIIGNKVESIGASAFYNCSGLMNVTIGDSVISIGDYAFAYCNSIMAITIPSCVNRIADSAFYYCGGEIERIIVNEGNTSYHSQGNKHNTS